MSVRYFYFSVFVVSKTFEESAEETEEWYGTKYSVKKIPSGVIKVPVLLLQQQYTIHSLALTKWDRKRQVTVSLLDN